MCSTHCSASCHVIKTDQVSEFILQCRNFTKFLRKPANGLRYLLEVNKIRLPQIVCPTRWSSTFSMINDLKLAKLFITSQEI